MYLYYLVSVLIYIYGYLYFHIYIYIYIYNRSIFVYSVDGADASWSRINPTHCTHCTSGFSHQCSAHIPFAIIADSCQDTSQCRCTFQTLPEAQWTRAINFIAQVICLSYIHPDNIKTLWHSSMSDWSHYCTKRHQVAPVSCNCLKCLNLRLETFLSKWWLEVTDTMINSI